MGQSSGQYQEYSVACLVRLSLVQQATVEPGAIVTPLAPLLGGTNTLPTTVLPATELGAVPAVRWVEVDNPTPLLLVLPECGIQVMPWLTGVRVPLAAEQRRVSIQATALGKVFTLGDGAGYTFTATVRFWSQAPGGAPSGGAGSPSNLVMNLSSYNDALPVSTSADLGLSNFNGLVTIGAYDTQAADTPPLGLLARSPNIWLTGNPGNLAAAAGWNTVLTYTAPANRYWRLLWLQAGIENATAQIGAGRLFWRVQENGAMLLYNGAIPRDAGQFCATTGPVIFPGAGLRAASAASTLTVDVYADTPANCQGRAQVGLYVGP